MPHIGVLASSTADADSTVTAFHSKSRSRADRKGSVPNFVIIFHTQISLSLPLKVSPPDMKAEFNPRLGGCGRGWGTTRLSAGDQDQSQT